MKKYMLIAMLAFLAVPVFANVSPGYSPVVMSTLVAVDTVGNATAVTVIEDVEVQAANTQTELTPSIEKAKTGTGMFNAVNLGGCNQTGPSHRHLSLFEVGWRRHA